MEDNKSLQKKWSKSMVLFIKDTKFDQKKKQVWLYFNNDKWSDEDAYYWQEFDYFSKVWQKKGREAMELEIINEVRLNMIRFIDNPEITKDSLFGVWDWWIDQQKEINNRDIRDEINIFKVFDYCPKGMSYDEFFHKKDGTGGSKKYWEFDKQDSVMCKKKLKLMKILWAEFKQLARKEGYDLKNYTREKLKNG